MGQVREVCIPCLKKGLTDREYEEIVRKYVLFLDVDLRVSDEVYEMRLETCSHCEFLRNGICRLCGCFVEVRAAKKINGCADTPMKWEPVRYGD